jgi:hydrogenase expression/formation protein HypE
MSADDAAGPSCPLPAPPGPLLGLAHGSGGRRMHALLRDHVGAAFGPEVLRHDGAVLPGGLVLTTDASVVRPLFFPGGDLGRLAVFGTVNDLAVTGARPLALSLALVLEEGLPLSTLDRLLQSARAAADAVGVSIVTGDTKVVERGRGDGVYAATTGLGQRLPGVEIDARRVRPGDRLLLSGDVGRHGVAVLSAREGLSFGGAVDSDLADLSGPVLALLGALPGLPFLRDCTRGGVAAVLHELAHAADLRLWVEERAVPVGEAVRGATAILGLDPLQLACEGRFLAVAPPALADAALALLRAHPTSAGACCIGEVGPRTPGGEVWLRTPYGQERPLVWPDGELLPRIC